MPVVDVPPRFRIVSPPPPGDEARDPRTLAIVPSPAFGDGRHETTCMCLQALAVFAPAAPFRLLDVGSGSGVLSIAAAKLGGEAVGVEIDEAANAVARESADVNGVGERVTFGTAWPDATFPIVVANILRGILLELADAIAARLEPGGALVLSGLVSTDVPAILAAYVPRLDGRRPDVFERGPWRTLVWRRASRLPA